MSYPGFDLSGKTAVVIGGTAGIGRALSCGLAEAGANVVATSRRPDQVELAAVEIEQRGRRTLRLTSDVVDRSTLERLLSGTLDAFGQVHILVNCAARLRRIPTLDVSEAEWNETLDTNLTGTLRACQIFGRHMLDCGYGRIINIASISGCVAFHEVAAYDASKAAVAALTRSLAVEWAPRGVMVNAIAPGVVRTEMNEELLQSTPRGREILMRSPIQRFGKAEEFAGAAVFLASDAASFVSGEVLVVDGGYLASGVNQ